MSAPQFRCPHCAAPIVLPSGNATRVQCSQCATTFDLAPPVPAPVSDVPEAVAVPEAVPVANAPSEVVPQPVPVAVPSAFAFAQDEHEEEDEDDPAPKRRRRRRDRDEEDEEEDDEDDRPRRRGSAGRAPKARRGDSGAKIAIFACVGAVLLIGVAVGGYFAFRAPPKEVVKNDPAPPPKKEQPKKEQPPPTPEQMVRKVKGSTVYIRTFFRDGTGATGSGFFAGKPGYVVTNAHVIGYGPVRVTEPEKVEVVVDSGEPGERAVTAKVFGLDAELDLAVLRVEMRDMPPPLPFGRAEGLVETQEVVIFGYPFGESLGKNVSINPTTVSSLRKANGSVETVQLAGGLNPGNSGGPVTNKKGEVIGVSVAKFRGTDTIGFAIPAEVADRFVDDMHACGGELRLGYLKFIQPPPKGPGIAPGSKQTGWAPLQIPPPKPVAVRPVQFDGDSTEVQLAGTADGACVGGGGRFLIFRLPADKCLAVFDVCEAKVVKSVPAPEDALFAAGMNSLVIVDAENDTVERWSLTTFTKEAEADLPVSPKATVTAVAMGGASNGPLLVLARDAGPGERFLFDVTAMKEVKGSRAGTKLGVQSGDALRAGADGRTFLHARGNGAAALIAVTDTGYHEAQLPGAGPRTATTLGGDGQLGYQPDGTHGRAGLRGGPSFGWPCLPAVQGPLVLAMSAEVRERERVLAVHAGRDRAPLFVVPPVPALTAVLDRTKASRLDRHVFFVPAARAVAVLSPDGTAITLCKLDVDAELEKADDYLFVASAPPAAAAGRSFDYRIAVKSKKPAAGFKLLSGPPGLTVSDDGRVSWDVPATSTKPAVVVVAITDAADKEHRHEFELIPAALPE
ncbi:MAG: serine protease [Planctomycetes bacterium]|nr:serine protease [Planctomycetota bacterium]